MSTSRLRTRPKADPPAKRDGGGHQFPPTVTCPVLLDKDSDGRFRGLINDLFTVATRMEIVREHLGRCMGIGGPQYSMLIAVAHLAGEHGISVGALAQAMHVSSAFVASETGKMARLGLLFKRSNPKDGRGILLSIAPAGRLKIDGITGELRVLNDLFFGTLDRKSFNALCVTATALVDGSNAAMQYVSEMESGRHVSFDAAG
jgi:MarR family transcriptional regulator, organic hydroperoxide resistance regulator